MRSLAGSPAGACIWSFSASLVRSAWVVTLRVCQYTRTASCVVDTAKFRYRVLCPVQLHIYSTLTTETLPRDRQRAACILFASTVSRGTLRYSVGSKYAQTVTNVTAHDRRQVAAQIYPCHLNQPTNQPSNPKEHRQSFTALY